MKKILFLVLLCFGLLQIAQAQVIELIGIGVRDVNPGVLVISDPGTVDHVVIEAAGIFRNYSVPSDVRFWDDDEDYTVSFNLAEIDLAPGIINGESQNWGYYTATFNTIDADGEISLDKLGNMDADEEITAITAFVYRTGGGSGVYSEAKGDHAFLYHNGAADPLVYNFTIPFSFEPRDVSVTLSFSEVNADGRFSVIDVTAGLLSAHVEFDDNNKGNLLHIETVTIPDVPGDVTEVTVSVYSPDPNVDGKTGDSFLTGAALLTTTYEQGCTLTQGYWKTHSSYGPAAHPDDTWNLVGGPDATFFLSGQTYLQVLNTAVKGNAYYILAHQYIAAELNMLAGAYLGEVEEEFDDAADLLAMYTPAQVKSNKSVSALFTSLGGLLDDFNNGIIGPGHCGEEYESTEKSAVINDNSLIFRELTVYPNPVKGVATLTFNPNFDGNTSVELFSATGQKTTTLFNQNVRKDVPVRLTFNSHQFTEGLYIIRVQNGSSFENLKIQIGK